MKALHLPLLWLALATPAQAATILLPDGSPAAGARAVSLAGESFVRVTGAEFVRPVEPVVVGDGGDLVVTPETAGRWLILHERGWADAALLPETAELRLDPWSEVSGTVSAPHAPDTLVSYHRTERPRRKDDGGSIFWSSTAPVAEDGSFVLRQVPRGHGSVGILHEARNERRVQRWRDFVRWVQVPSLGPVHLAGGVAVSGRIVAGDLPAMITLASRDVNPTGHALTDADGRFTIPGVLPGKYRLFARPDLGRATKSIPHRDVEVGTAPLDLGDLAGGEPDVEIDSRVECDAGLMERIRTEAAAHSDRPIEKIWIGELVHPTGQYGARVTFAPHADPADPTRATQTTLLLDIPGEQIRKHYPEHDSLGFGFRFSEAPFGKSRTFERPLRVFPLGQRTLHLPLDDGVDYDEALALLRAIESDTIQRIKPKSEKLPDGSWRGTIHVVGDIKPDDLPSVTAVQKGDAKGEIKLQTRTRPFSGGCYQFKKTPDGFLLSGVSNWVS